MEVGLRDKRAHAPGSASIRGPEIGDRKGVRVQADIGYDYRAIGLNQGLPTEAMSAVSGGLSWSPRQPSVGGGAHLLKVAVRGIVVLGITVSIMGTARAIVADRPVFVIKIP